MNFFTYREKREKKTNIGYHQIEAVMSYQRQITES